MTYYKKISTIQNCLYDNNVPTDLHSIIFDYYGDLDESVEDLMNKHCFYQINCSSFIQRLRGYYCQICNKFLEVKSMRQLQRHINSVEHRHNLQDDDCDKPRCIQDFKKCCGDKWFKNMPKVPKKFKKNFIDDLTPQNIEICFNKMN